MPGCIGFTFGAVGMGTLGICATVISMRTTATLPRKPRSRPSATTELRRKEIVDAAVKVFSKHGFEAARAEDIAHAAHIAKGTLYLYYRSKEAMYSAAIARAVDELQVLAAERIEMAPSFQDKLTAAIATRLHFWTEHQSLYRLLLTLGREPRHRRQTNQLLRSGQRNLLDIFEEGVAQEKLRSADYAALAWGILDMIRGATERRMDRCTETSVEADAAAIVAFALRAAESY